MRSTRVRAVVAGVLGVAAIALASPASAATPAPSPTATVAVSSPTPTSPAGVPASPSATPTPTALPLATTSTSADPSAAASLDPSATPSPVAGGTASVDPSASASAIPPAGAASTEGTGDPILDGFLDLLPFKVPLDKEINGVEDIDANPLVLTFICNGSEPAWKLKNTGDKSFGWFDTNLGGGILNIGPKQTVDIPSKALAVVGSPWDAETKLLLVTVPTVGVSNCGGASSVPPAIPAPAPLPVAVPAVSRAVTADPYYTR